MQKLPSLHKTTHTLPSESRKSQSLPAPHLSSNPYIIHNIKDQSDVAMKRLQKKSDKNSFELSKNYKEGKLIDDGKIQYYEDFTHEKEKYTKSKILESGSNGMIIQYVYINPDNKKNILL